MEIEEMSKCKKLIENPGSKEAIKLGCKCPVLDNNNGAGLGDGLFWYAGDCKYHQQYPIQPTDQKRESKETS